MNKQSSLLYKELLESTNSAPLSQTMPMSLRLAREFKIADFEKWLRLEIGGYFKDNPAMTTDVKVPEYRNVVGQHFDKYGRPFIVHPNAEFVNNIPLRNGIDELEKMAAGTEMLTMQNPLSIQMLREMFNVDVYAFQFSPLQITGILGSIRLRLSDWLYDVQRSHPSVTSELEKETVMSLEKHQPIHVTLGDGASVGNLVISRSITNSFNKLESAEISDELKKVLQELAKAVQEMTSTMPSETAEQVARDLETLTAEATSKSPRQQWWQLSVEGLKKAAKDVGEIGIPVLKLAASVITLLSMKP